MPDSYFHFHTYNCSRTMTVLFDNLFNESDSWEARKNWPVVSVPGGAHSAKQQPYLMGFDEVVQMFDNDLVEASPLAQTEIETLTDEEYCYFLGHGSLDIDAEVY